MTTIPLASHSSPDNALSVRNASAEYTVLRFTEPQNPSGALRAHEIQGESYVHAGFVHEQALDACGRLPTELDAARGPFVEYLLAEEKSGAAGAPGQGAVRRLEVTERDGLDALPSWRYCGHALRPETRSRLRRRFDDVGAAGFAEISGLSRTVGSNPMILFELIRVLLQQAWSQPVDVTWVIAFADRTFRAMQHHFGANTITQAGAAVTRDPQGRWTRSSLCLIPVVVDTRRLPETMLDEIRTTPDSPSRAALIRTLRLITTGLGNELGDRVDTALSRYEVTS